MIATKYQTTTIMIMAVVLLFIFMTYPKPKVHSNRMVPYHSNRMYGAKTRVINAWDYFKEKYGEYGTALSRRERGQFEMYRKKILDGETFDIPLTFREAVGLKGMLPDLKSKMFPPSAPPTNMFDDINKYYQGVNSWFSYYPTYSPPGIHAPPSNNPTWGQTPGIVPYTHNQRVAVAPPGTVIAATVWTAKDLLQFYEMLGKFFVLVVLIVALVIIVAIAHGCEVHVFDCPPEEEDTNQGIKTTNKQTPNGETDNAEESAAHQNEAVLPGCFIRITGCKRRK